MAIHPIVLLHKLNTVLMAALKPLGVWGLGGLAFIDSAFFPLPTTMNGLVLDYVAGDHGELLIYCLVAAAASSVGSMVPYYVGRAGGEVFLLKRINRQRYEKMRDRFERQEFLAIMIPAMLPPPTPIKLFEFGAGVFEMKPLPFMLAIFTGKFIQFLLWSLAFVFFGPGIVHAVGRLIHQHADIVIGVLSAVGLVLVLYFVRKLFDRGRGQRFPAEEREPETPEIDESDDSTLIT